MIVSVVGNFSTTEMLDMLEETLGKLPEKPLPARVRLNQLADQRRIWDIELEETKEVSQEKELQAAWMIIGYPAPSVDSDDYPILKLINTILGGGMSSRFFVELRDKRGLAYDTSSFFPSREGPSHFVGYIITSPENVEQAKEGMLEEIERLKTELVSDEELEKAKKYLIGSFALAHQRNKDQAWYLGWYETMGAGYEFDAKYPEQIETVTKEDIMEVANKYFTEAHIVSILMPTEK